MVFESDEAGVFAMMRGKGLFSSRVQMLSFWLGCAAVATGVLLHLPMFIESADMGYHLAGMAMDPGMIVGMALIVGGTMAAGYGLLPDGSFRRVSGHSVRIQSADDGKLTASHWMLMAIVVLALIIDTMKPATLGFVVPGMREEYGLTKSGAAWLPLVALTGTAVGSLMWGAIADLYGRRASILLAAIMFVGTSICGAMPSFAWNLVMCFLMGASAGGLLPVAYVLLTEAVPVKQRGWILVAVGGLGTAGGYLAASGFSWLLQPIFGWRIMWLIGLPTGLLLILLNRFIPESPKFLLLHGRLEEAKQVMRRFGATFADDAAPSHSAPPDAVTDTVNPWGAIVALTVTGLTWGVLNFGLLLWLPAELHARGFSIVAANALLARSALLAFPAVAIGALSYSLWSTKWSLVGTLVAAASGLLGITQLDGALTSANSELLPFLAFLVMGTNGILAVLLPYAAENSPLRWRGRATGWVAAATKMGGIVAQACAVLSVVPPAQIVAFLLLGPIAISIVLIAWYGAETRGRVLIDAESFQTL
jgi:putative MFS transporter